MNRLRDNTGVILWILVFAFGVIWVLQDSGTFNVVGNIGNNIGVVNGEPITIDEFSRAVDAQVQNYQQQTGESMPPQMLDQTRDRVFDQLVEAKLRLQEMARLGLDVADEELVDMIQGENPHAIIKTYFGDENGNVDRALLQNFIENPDAQDDWLQIEDYLRNERRREKLDKLIAATVRVSDVQVLHDYKLRNTSVDVRFISLRYTALPDDSISYDDGDIRRFYNDHKEEFKRNRSYALSYVTLSKAPTAEDTAAVFKDIEDLRDSFEAATDDSLFLARNGSERGFTDAFFRPDELDTEIADAVYDHPVAGNIVGPLLSGDQVHLIKIVAVQPPEETSVKASHILFRAAEGDSDARAKALQEARSVRKRILAGEDFATLAKEFSQDGSASNGGNLGWFGPGRMVKPFEEAAFRARIGRVTAPVESRFGYHLILVTNRADVDVQLADFALSLRASVATLNRVQEQLDDLQYFASESEDFAAEASRRNMSVQTVQIEEGQTFIPALGNSRALDNFLATARVGDISPVIELNDQFLVASVEEITPEGYRPFEEVKTQLEPRLRNEMKSQLQVERLKTALKDGFDGAAERAGTVEQTAEGISYENMTVTGVGRDPDFAGTALGLQEGAVSHVIAGENAAFVLQVIARHEPDPPTDAQKGQLFSQILNQEQNQVRSSWISTLKEEADIVDNRRLFLQ